MEKIMNRSVNVIATTVLALTAAGLLTTGNSVAAGGKTEMEKCYGIAKAGRNDCATSSSSCAGTSTEDRQKDAYIAIPKGTCSKIAGGSLVAK